MKRYVFFILLGILVSCKRERPFQLDDCYLEATGTIKSFSLDSDVRYNAFFLYVFREDDGKEYLSFLNHRSNQILFYDWKTTDFLFKIELDTEGPHGVVQPSGYYVKDFNNIYVSSYAYEGLIRVDTNACIVQKIPYGMTEDGYKVIPSYTPSSQPYVAPFFHDGKMYIIQNDADHLFPIAQTPLTVSIDTTCCKYEGSLQTYGVLSEDVLASKNMKFSRIFDGKQLIYSFFTDEDIFVVSADQKETKKIKVKSQYISDPSIPQKSGPEGPRSNLEVARYGNLIYDPYREVYYRFAYPKTELKDDINWWGKAVYGRKKFSVIILDKEFNVIGETLFPEAVYNSYVFFVHEDGLYISRDYQMLYEQSEDYMTFERFSLKRNVSK